MNGAELDKYKKGYLSAKIKNGDIIKKGIKWLVAILMLAVVFLIVYNISKNDISRFDDYIYKHISFLISPKITFIFKIITNLGSVYAVVAICLVSFIFIKDKRYGKMISLNLIIISILNFVLKNIFNRTRPTGLALIEETGRSFPSGHSMINMAFYGLIVYFIYIKVKNKYIKWISVSILSILIVLIGISRIYLGVHYASDVVAGFCISIAYLILFTSILNKSKT